MAIIGRTGLRPLALRFCCEGSKAGSPHNSTWKKWQPGDPVRCSGIWKAAMSFTLITPPDSVQR
jgi:hypothetical protein